jgi:predicted anti-sigma-YlaC factor YlaD
MTCHEFEGLLCALLDGSVASEDHARCLIHAAACAMCGELVLPMGARLAPVAVAPPASFVPSVLRLTSGAKRRAAWSETWRTWVLRPRFASETAYVGVVVLTLACASIDKGTVTQIRSRAGILLDRASSLLEKEKP